MEPSRNPSLKRSLDHGSPDSPLLKRLRPEDLLELLEHDADLAVEQEERGAGGERELESVIRSFEEEITGDVGELGFLLHASDDELGLPPPRDSDEPAPPEPEREVAAGGGAAEEENGELGFGWCDEGLFGPLDLLTDVTWQPMPAL